MKKTKYTLLALGTVALAAASMLSACVKDDPNSPGWEYFPDMYRSPSIESNGASMHIDSVVENGKWVIKDTTYMGNMLPPTGTIPRGFTPFPYDNTPQGDSLASAFWKNPLEHSNAVEEQGKFLYERYCIYCHGAAGDGNGPLVASGKYGAVPPNYKTRYDAGVLTDGHVYHVITYGKGNMGSHASQLTPEERWKVIEYVQRLGRGGKPWSEFSAMPKADTAAAADSAKVKPAEKKK